MKNRALIYVIVASLLWGTSGIFVHYLAPCGVSSVQMTAIRGSVSLVTLTLYTFFYDKSLFKVRLSDLPLLMGAGISMFLTSSCYYISMQMTSVSTSVILMYTAPLFVLCYSVLFMGEKLTKLKTISVIGMFVGCGLVSGIIGGMKFNALGIAIGLLSGIAYSAYNIFTKIEMTKKIPPISATFYCYVFMSLIALLVSSPGEIITVAVNNSITISLLMVALGIFTSVLPYFLYTLGLKLIPAGVASSLGIMEPLAATLYSFLLFRENIGIYQLIGIILIVGAIVALSWNAEEQHEKDTAFRRLHSWGV